MMKNAMRLSRVFEEKRIPFIHSAISHGSHCPLFCVVMAAPFVEGVATLVVGTAECCWHSRNQYHSNGGRGLFYTYVLDDTELVFGASEGVSAAIREIWADCRPRAIQVVTSCVPELIGESADLLAAMADVPVPMLSVRTSHYNSSGYYQGLTRYYSSFVSVMEKTKATNDVVLLGARYEGVERSELYRFLLEAGKSPIVPSRFEDVKCVPDAALIVVMDVTALDAAERVHERFGTPIVRLDRLCRPEEIRDAYRQIDAYIGTDLEERTHDLHDAVLQKIDAARQLWKGKGFACAAPFFLSLDATLFFMDLGMLPEFVLMRDFYKGDEKWAQDIIAAGCNPQVASFASMSELEESILELGISLLFGPTHLSDLAQAGILNVNPNRMASCNGYQLPLGILQQMEGSCEGERR